MRFPITAQVGLVRRIVGATDPYGNPVESWSDPIPIGVYGYGPRTAGDAEPNLPNRDMVVIGVTVYGPESLASQVTALDRMEVPLGGPLYEIEGEVGDFNHGPFGFKPGCTVTLKRVEG